MTYSEDYLHGRTALLRRALGTGQSHQTVQRYEGKDNEEGASYLRCIRDTISKSLADMIACMRTLIVQNNAHMRILFSTLTLVTLNSDS